MSTVYKYQDSETAISVPPNPADIQLSYSTLVSGTRTVTATLNRMSPVTVTNLTSASTGTNILPYGITTITSSNSALGYLLSPPTYAGFKTTISTLSTGGPVVTVSGATVLTGASTAIVTLTFNGLKGARIQLEALSTTTWLHASSTTTAHVALT